MNKAKRPKWFSLLHEVDDMVETAYLIVAFLWQLPLEGMLYISLL